MNKDLRIKAHKSSIVNPKSSPIQYQRGYVEFYKLKFKVTPDVLIPRPETELLVDEVLNFIKNQSSATNNQKPITILDVGTGAGAIAIALAKNLASHSSSGKGDIIIIATDVSKEAIEIAKQNALFHGVEDQIQFIQNDLLSSICHSEALVEESSTNVGNKEPDRKSEILRFTQDDILIIVTNLPYIPSARIPYLDSSVKDYEPHVALDGGEDGFELYRKLFQQIKEKNWEPKLILGEIDYTHGELAANEAYNYFPGTQIEVKKDLAHLQRIFTIRYP